MIKIVSLGVETFVRYIRKEVIRDHKKNTTQIRGKQKGKKREKEEKIERKQEKKEEARGWNRRERRREGVAKFSKFIR